jgi:hypothetical protein
MFSKISLNVRKYVLRFPVVFRLHARLIAYDAPASSRMCQNSKICLKKYTKSSKICLKSYAKTSKIQASRHIEKHTFHHVEILVHEMSDHQTFFNFSIKKRASFSNPSLTLRDWTEQWLGLHVTSIGKPARAS